MAKQGGRDVERRSPTDVEGNGRDEISVSPGAPTAADEARVADKPSLESLEGAVPAPVPPGTPVEKRCEELRKKPIEELTADELQLQIGQRIGLDYLVPAALDVLERDPLVSGEYYPGDLLGTVLRLERGFWTEHRALHERAVAVLERVEAPEEIVDEVQDFPRELV
jgi:hypothetical protein